MSTDSTSERPAIAAGLAVYTDLRGAERAEGMRRAIDMGGVGSVMTALSMEFVFGRVWSRDGLDRRQRSLVTIGLLIGLRHPEELRNHIRIGLTNGLSAREIEEAILQTAAYAGFPAAHMAIAALVEALEDPAAPSTDTDLRTEPT